MKALVLDVETSVKHKGNPFCRDNRLVCVGLKNSNKTFINFFDYDNEKEFIQKRIDESDILVGFNIKFDLHWLRNIGVDISKIRVWDCQLAEFILNYQKTPYPSLDGAAEKYGLPKKLDIIKTKYWDKGIDTPDIPRDILSEYLEQDLNLTQQVYEKQLEQFKTIAAGLFPLFKLHCHDLLVLEEMEFNGIKFNTEKALTKAKELQNELEAIQNKLVGILGGIPFNPNSGDHVSAALYGGIIVQDVRIPVGVYKSGNKSGQTRYKVIQKEYILERMCEPIKGTETKKSKEKSKETGTATIWETNETVLRKLKLTKKAKEFVDLLRRQSELEKLRGTYLEGYSKLIEEMNWEPDTLHGTLNQCVVVTGRLSSSKPNLQNADPTTKVFMETRYADYT